MVSGQEIHRTQIIMIIIKNGTLLLGVNDSYKIAIAQEQLINNQTVNLTLNPPKNLETLFTGRFSSKLTHTNNREGKSTSSDRETGKKVFTLDERVSFDLNI